MRNFLTWLAILLLGLSIGIGGAFWSISSSDLGNDIRIGPWSTGRDVGTADADMRTRAIVALRGLLALPASEARYFTARTDSTGRPLDGRCLYTIEVAQFPARWWSITVYDRAGWLIPNAERRHSVGSAGAVGSGADRPYTIGPRDHVQTAAGGIDPNWTPVGREGPFELTLRAYRPAAALRSDRPEPLPAIRREGCLE